MTAAATVGRAAADGRPAVTAVAVRAAGDLDEPRGGQLAEGLAMEGDLASWILDVLHGDLLSFCVVVDDRRLVDRRWHPLQAACRANGVEGRGDASRCGV